MTQAQIQVLKTAQLWAMLRLPNLKGFLRFGDEMTWVRMELRKRGYDL